MVKQRKNGVLNIAFVAYVERPEVDAIAVIRQ
jgi:hypothetical protein